MTPYDTSWTGKKDVRLRDYTNIYAARNVDNPIGDSIKLGYISNIDDIKFKKDDFTYFHFPLKRVDEVDGEPVSNKFYDIDETTLIVDGATCGSAPYKSDRIYKMRYNYENTSPYGRAQPEKLDNGKWLCSWLSGNVLDKSVVPVWMDRWFDPSVLTEEEAMLKKDSSVYDVPSEMSFDFGAYYRYWRVGNKTIGDVVDRIGIGNTLKIHHPTVSWRGDIASTSIDDRVVYKNLDETSLDNYRVSDDFEDGEYAITFNGRNQYATIPFNDSIGHVTVDQYSILFWVRNESWENTTTYSVVDNMYMGGWKFGVTNHSDNLFMFLFGNDEYNAQQDGTSCLFNVNGDLVSTKSYWKNNELNGYRAVLMDMLIDIDNYCFVLDYDEENGVSYVRKQDYFGNQLGFIRIPDKLQYLDMSDEKHGYVIYAYKVDGSKIAAYTIDRYVLSYEKISNDEYHDPDDPDAPLIPSRPPCSDVAESNPIIDVNVRLMSNAGIIKINGEYFTYKKDVAAIVDNGKETTDGIWLNEENGVKYHTFAALDDVVSVAADYDNNIWILHSDSVERYSVVYHEYKSTFKFNIKRESKFNVIDFISKNVKGKNIDYILLISTDKQCVTEYSMDGAFVDSYDSSKFYVRPCNSRRCTMYDWFRRNRYLTNCMYFDVSDSVGHNRIRKYLDGFGDGEWHLIGGTVGVRGDGRYVSRFYVDCQLVGEKELTPKLRADESVECSTTYRFDSPITLGGIGGKIHPIMDEINVANGSFAGSIDDFRVYSRAITAEDMYYVYMSKYVCEDLIWHLKNSDKNYVENIERFYKFKMPGSKSAQYVLHIRGYKNEDGELDEELRLKLEDMIHKAFKKITPSYTSLLKIVWE